MTDNVLTLKPRTELEREKAEKALDAALTEQAALTNQAIALTQMSVAHLMEIVAAGETRIFWGVLPMDPSANPVTFSSSELMLDPLRAVGLMDVMRQRLASFVIAEGAQ